MYSLILLYLFKNDISNLYYSVFYNTYNLNWRLLYTRWKCIYKFINNKFIARISKNYTYINV